MVKSIALIGSGYMGREYAKALKGGGLFNLTGVLKSSRAQALANDYSISLVAHNIEELYQETKADAVIVAVPELVTREVMFEVLKYPWIVLLEKPPGYLPSIAQEIFDEASSLSKEVYVALNRRFYSSTNAALELVKGERHLIIQDQEDQNVALSIGQPKEVVDAWMYANSIHIIDYALLFCRGEIISVRQIQGLNPYKPSIVRSEIRFSSGDTATYIGVWQMPGPWAVQILTESARYELKPLEMLSIQNRGERQSISVPVDILDTEFKPGLRRMLEELYKAVIKEEHRLPPLSEGIKLMNLIERMF
jgi:predicted dehydrogenase